MTNQDLLVQEIERLVAEYGDKIEIISEDPFKLKVLVLGQSSDILEKDHMSAVVLFTYPEKYPHSAPLIDIECTENMSKDQQKSLMDLMVAEGHRNVGRPMTFKLIDAVQQRLNDLMQDTTQEKEVTEEINVDADRPFKKVKVEKREKNQAEVEDGSAYDARGSELSELMAQSQNIISKYFSSLEDRRSISPAERQEAACMAEPELQIVGSDNSEWWNRQDLLEKFPLVKERDVHRIISVMGHNVQDSLRVLEIIQSCFVAHENEDPDESFSVDVSIDAEVKRFSVKRRVISKADTQPPVIQCNGCKDLVTDGALSNHTCANKHTYCAECFRAYVLFSGAMPCLSCPLNSCGAPFVDDTEEKN